MTSTKKIVQEFREIKKKYIWIIKNFSSLSDIPETAIVPPNFLNCTFDNLVWTVILYPNGYNNYDKGNISVIFTPQNRKTESAFFEITAFSSVKVYNTDQKLHENTFLNLIQRDILLTDLKEGNDSLTIVIKIRDFLDVTLKTQPQDDLLKDFALLLEMEQSSDIILVSSDETEHKAHKAILMCRSKVFSAMFSHNMKESQNNAVKIDDIDSKTLKAVLEYLYTGKVKFMPEKTTNLLIAADKYELDNLKKLCVEYLLQYMRYDNVLDLIDFANNYNFEELKEESKRFFFQYSKEVRSLNGFNESLQNLSRSTLEELFYGSLNNQR